MILKKLTACWDQTEPDIVERGQKRSGAQRRTNRKGGGYPSCLVKKKKNFDGDRFLSNHILSEKLSLMWQGGGVVPTSSVLVVLATPGLWFLLMGTRVEGLDNQLF